MKIIYHTDLDGHCAAAISLRWARLERRAGNKDCTAVELIPMNYGWDFPWGRFEAGELVHMVDFSLPEEDMERLVGLVGAEKLVWLDHHATQIKMEQGNEVLKALRGARVDGTAGCELTWAYLFGTKVPEAVRRLGRFDVWDFADEPEIMTFKYGMESVPNEPAEEIWDEVIPFPAKAGDPKTVAHPEDIARRMANILEAGCHVQYYVEEQNRIKAAGMAFEAVLQGHGVIAQNSGGNSAALEPVFNPDRHAFMVLFWLNKRGIWDVRLYGTPSSTLHLGELAKYLSYDGKGGGHVGAAGYQTDVRPFK